MHIELVTDLTSEVFIQFTEGLLLDVALSHICTATMGPTLSEQKKRALLLSGEFQR